MKSITREMREAVYRFKLQEIDPDQAAKKLGISKAQMYRILDGSSKEIRYSTFDKLKNALGNELSKPTIEDDIKSKILSDPLLMQIIENWEALTPEEVGDMARITITAQRRNRRVHKNN